MTPFLSDYTVVVNPRQKHTYLRLKSDGKIVVSTPGLSTKEIEALLIRKARWIRKARDKHRSKKGFYPDFDTRTVVTYLGNDYPLYVERTQQKSTLYFHNNRFYYRGVREIDALHRALDRFYRNACASIFPDLVERYAETMSLRPLAIRYRKTKRQWGSCSSDNRLSFNTMLCKTPYEAIEYVVVHELAHIAHKNHSKAFWDTVGTYLPDYRKRRTLLQRYVTY